MFLGRRPHHSQPAKSAHTGRLGTQGHAALFRDAYGQPEDAQEAARCGVVHAPTRPSVRCDLFVQAHLRTRHVPRRRAVGSVRRAVL